MTHFEKEVSKLRLGWNEPAYRRKKEEEAAALALFGRLLIQNEGYLGFGSFESQLLVSIDHLDSMQQATTNGIVCPSLLSDVAYVLFLAKHDETLQKDIEEQVKNFEA